MIKIFICLHHDLSMKNSFLNLTHNYKFGKHSLGYLYLVKKMKTWKKFLISDQHKWPNRKWKTCKFSEIFISLEETLQQNSKKLCNILTDKCKDETRMFELNFHAELK